MALQENVDASSADEQRPRLGAVKTPDRSIFVRLCLDCVDLYRRFQLFWRSKTELIYPSLTVQLTRSYEALVLWAKAHDIVEGGLDDVLKSSCHLRRRYLKSLTSISITLMGRLPVLVRGLESLVATSPLQDTFQEGLDCLEATYRDDDSFVIQPDFPFDSLEEIGQDLEVDVDCLLGLDPLFRSPISDSEEAHATIASVAEDSDVEVLQEYSSIIKDMFPGVVSMTMARLARAVRGSLRKRASAKNLGHQTTDQMPRNPPRTRSNTPGTMGSIRQINPCTLTLLYTCPFQACSERMYSYRTHREFFNHFSDYHFSDCQSPLIWDDNSTNIECPLCYSIFQGRIAQDVDHICRHLTDILFRAYRLLQTRLQGQPKQLEEAYQAYEDELQKLEKIAEYPERLHTSPSSEAPTAGVLKEARDKQYWPQVAPERMQQQTKSRQSKQDKKPLADDPDTDGEFTSSTVQSLTGSCFDVDSTSKTVDTSSKTVPSSKDSRTVPHSTPRHTRTVVLIQEELPKGISRRKSR